MSSPHGIIIFGANGSGKTTLGRELANVLRFKHMDIEDYHFEKSEIPQLYKLAVFVSAPIELRIKRIEQREYEKHGERICKGGDMYEQHKKFADFVASRSLPRIDHWAAELSCPALQVDGTKEISKNT